MRAAHWISRIRPFVLLLAQVIFLVPAQLFAAELAFTFHDMAGDPRDKTDVTKVYFQFDNQTGNFNVEVTTDPANPFNGTHLLYLSVFNPDVGTTDRAISFFEIGRFGFTAATPTTVLSRTGN